MPAAKKTAKKVARKRPAKKPANRKVPAKKSAKKPAKKPVPKRRVARKKTTTSSSSDNYSWNDVAAIILLGGGAILLLALISFDVRDLPSWVGFSMIAENADRPISNFIGPIGAVVAGYLFFILGAAAYLLPAAMLWFGLYKMVTGFNINQRSLWGFLIFLVSGASLLHLQTSFLYDWAASINLANHPGGFLGKIVGGGIMKNFLGQMGAFIVVSIAYAIGLIMLTGIHPTQFINLLRKSGTEWWQAREKRKLDEADDAELLAIEERKLAKERKRLERKVKGSSVPIPEELLEEEDIDEVPWEGQDPGYDRDVRDYESDEEWVVAAAEAKPEPETPKKRVTKKVAKKKAPVAAAEAPSVPAPVEAGETVEVSEEDIAPEAKTTEAARPEPKIFDSSVAEKEESPKKLPTPEELQEQLEKVKEDARAKAKERTHAPVNAFENYLLPSLGLLNFKDEEKAPPTDKNSLLEIQRTIVETLESFGIHVTPGDITKGPTITRYEIFPERGLRVNRIVSLEADLARATKAERINILAPIPGKDTVGIEIANRVKVAVPLRELIQDPKFKKGKCKIPLALGKDVYGKTLVADLAAMPHLLIAGATGSGKSVCINSVIASLLYQFTPDELRMIMIDPKVVEMQLYNKLPHMVVPVVTDPKKVLLALRWVVKEMESRYQIFAKTGKRNFESFNKRPIKKKRTAAEIAAEDSAAAPKVVDTESKTADASAKTADASAKVAKKATSDAPSEVKAPDENASESADGSSFWASPAGGELHKHEVNLGEEEVEEVQEDLFDESDIEIPDRLPYIVVIIDELADLMQTAPADVEGCIARITQMARAAGIHLIVATQSPRKDVITGVIKANVPSRIAFQVASVIDSRVILDAKGAEKLVGKGDMLYLPPGTSQLMRAQGAFLSDEEIQNIVEYCAAQGDPVYEPEVQQTLDGGGSEEREVSPEDEALIEKCLEVLWQEKKGSTSMLQRRLGLGYNRAARIMDIMEARGYVGPVDGAKPREILVDLSQKFG